MFSWICTHAGSTLNEIQYVLTKHFPAELPRIQSTHSTVTMAKLPIFPDFFSKQCSSWMASNPMNVAPLTRPRCLAVGPLGLLWSSGTRSNATMETSRLSKPGLFGLASMSRQRSISRTLSLPFCVSWSGGMWESWSQDEDEFDTDARNALKDWKLLSLQEGKSASLLFPCPLAAQELDFLDISVFAWTKGAFVCHSDRVSVLQEGLYPGPAARRARKRPVEACRTERCLAANKFTEQRKPCVGHCATQRIIMTGPLQHLASWWKQNGFQGLSTSLTHLKWLLFD